jgi:hypothetical protein
VQRMRDAIDRHWPEGTCRVRTGRWFVGASGCGCRPTSMRRRSSKSALEAGHRLDAGPCVLAAGCEHRQHVRLSGGEAVEPGD